MTLRCTRRRSRGWGGRGGEGGEIEGARSGDRGGGGDGKMVRGLYCGPIFFGHVVASEDALEHLAFGAFALDFAADLLFLALNLLDCGQVGRL